MEKHCVYYHRYHLVWSTRYRYKVLLGDLRLRVRDIVQQVCGEQGVEIIQGVLTSDLMRLTKGRSSRKVQREFPHLKNDTGAAIFGAGG